MPNLTYALLGGLAGAVALNLMHECTRKIVPDAPRMDILGMRAMSKLSRAAGSEPPENLRTATLAADVIVNSVFYSAAALGGGDNAAVLGTALGTAAGIGGVLLPGPMGLGSAESNRTRATQAMVIGMYATAGLLAGLAYQRLSDSGR